MSPPPKNKKIEEAAVKEFQAVHSLLPIFRPPTHKERDEPRAGVKEIGSFPAAVRDPSIKDETKGPDGSHLSRSS